MVLAVEPTPRQLLEGLDGLGDLIGALRAAELDNVVGLWWVATPQTTSNSTFDGP